MGNAFSIFLQEHANFKFKMRTFHNCVKKTKQLFCERKKKRAVVALFEIIMSRKKLYKR